MCRPASRALDKKRWSVMDSTQQHLLSLASPFADETADVLEVSTQMNISERRREDSTPKVDADFFNRQVDRWLVRRQFKGFLAQASLTREGAARLWTTTQHRWITDQSHLVRSFDDDFDESDMKPAA